MVTLTHPSTWRDPRRSPHSKSELTEKHLRAQRAELSTCDSENDKSAKIQHSHTLEKQYNRQFFTGNSSYGGAPWTIHVFLQHNEWSLPRHTQALLWKREGSEPRWDAKASLRRSNCEACSLFQAVVSSESIIQDLISKKGLKAFALKTAWLTMMINIDHQPDWIRNYLRNRAG